MVEELGCVSTIKKASVGEVPVADLLTFARNLHMKVVDVAKNTELKLVEA